MGKPVNSAIERVETIALNQHINKELFNAYKDYLKEQGYPMNVILEVFMRQYSKGKFTLRDEDVTYWEDDKSETAVISTTFNKEIYTAFKTACKRNGYCIKHVIMAFMKEYVSRDYVLEYVNRKGD